MTYVVPKKEILSTTYNYSIYEVEIYNDVLSTDAVDETLTSWDNTTSFVQGEFVSVSSLKRVYRCASATSVNEYPPANPTKWTDYGAINSFKMFDDIINSQTKFTTSCAVSLGFNSSNNLSLLNMKNVQSIRVVQTDSNSSTVVYDKTFSLIDYGVLSIYDYWYLPIKHKQNLILSDLYFLPNSTVDITFISNSDAFVGAVVSGIFNNLGLTLFGTSVKLNDYSKYLVDDFGNTTFSKRGYARTITGQVTTNTNLVDDTVEKLAELRGSITLFIGDERKDGYASLSTLGYIKDLTIAIDNPVQTSYPITIIGVI